MKGINVEICTKHYLNVFDIILFPKKTFITNRPLSDLAEYVKILFESWFLVDIDTKKEFLRIMETHIPRDKLFILTPFLSRLGKRESA